MKITLTLALLLAGFVVLGRTAEEPKSDVPQSQWTFTTKKPAMPYATGLMNPHPIVAPAR
jgi:hypothetical protein